MDRQTLEVKPRTTSGKGEARRLRARGGVPAVLYGKGAETEALEVEERHLAAVLRQGANQIIDLHGKDGFKDRLVLLKDYQRHPVSRQILHADFYTVDTQQHLEVDVPVHVEGKAHGVEMGGVLDLVLRELNVRCLPLSIPDSITIDVSALDIGDALHVRDAVLPEGVELLTDPALTLVHVVAPRVEEEPAEEEAAAAAEGEEAPAPSAEGEAPKAEEASSD